MLVLERIHNLFPNNLRRLLGEEFELPVRTIGECLILYWHSDFELIFPFDCLVPKPLSTAFKIDHAGILSDVQGFTIRHNRQTGRGKNRVGKKARYDNIILPYDYSTSQHSALSGPINTVRP